MLYNTTFINLIRELEIITPEIEFAELFARSLGGSSDVVTKEMYTFHDKKGEQLLTLRPEGTAGKLL